MTKYTNPLVQAAREAAKELDNARRLTEEQTLSNLVRKAFGPEYIACLEFSREWTRDAGWVTVMSIIGTNYYFRPSVYANTLNLYNKSNLSSTGEFIGKCSSLASLGRLLCLP